MTSPAYQRYKDRKAAQRAARANENQPDKDGFQFYNGRVSLVVISEGESDDKDT